MANQSYSVYTEEKLCFTGEDTAHMNLNEAVSLTGRVNYRAV